MSNMKCHPIMCMMFFNICIELACFICVCILCHISSKNPFKNHIIGDISNYFNIIEEKTDETPILDSNQIIGSNLDKARRRYISNENDTNIAPENKVSNKIFLRHLVSRLFCTEMQDYFIRFNGRKLSDIFDLNYEKIHKLSIATLVVSSIMIFFYILICAFEKKLKKNVWIGSIIAILFLLLYIAKLVLSIILIYYIEKGDIEKYDDFLDCHNVRVTLFDKFLEISTLRKCSFAFLILNFVEQGIDKLQKCCDYGEKANELEDD